MATQDKTPVLNQINHAFFVEKNPRRPLGMIGFAQDGFIIPTKSRFSDMNLMNSHGSNFEKNLRLLISVPAFHQIWAT